MLELIKVARILGVRHLVKLAQAERLGRKIERGFFMTRVINALFNIAFFDEFSKKDVVYLWDFASEKKIDLPTLETLCEYLYSLRILKRINEGYALDRNGSLISFAMRGTFDLIFGYENMMHELEPLLRKEKNYGQEIKRNGAFVAQGSGQAAKLLPFPVVADMILRENYKRPLDLACGNGDFLISLCKQKRTIVGHGVDISSEALHEARTNIRNHGLEDRIQLYQGDIFDLERMRGSIANADVATAFYILHEFLWPDSTKAIKFLASFRKFFKSKPLIVCEMMQQQPDILRKKPSLHLEYQLLQSLSQQGLAKREGWLAIFKKAGFKKVKERHLKFAKIGLFQIS